MSDIITGDSLVSPENKPYAGRSYVIFGHNGVWSSRLKLAILNGVNGLKIDGESAGDESGYAVSMAGDVNGDGIDDIVIGTVWSSPNSVTAAGRSYVIFGHRGNWSSPLDLAILDGKNGFEIDGEEPYDQSGISMGYAGDLNADGIDDVIIGAPYASLGKKNHVGRSYVVFGHRGSWTSPLALATLDGTIGFKIDGETADDYSCSTINSAVDFNGDGIGDIIIGAGNASPKGKTYAGRSYVIFGHNGSWSSPFKLSSLDGINGFKLDGEMAGDFSGISVNSAGDFNGDGISDIIIGAPGASPNNKTEAGRTYVIFGQDITKYGLKIGALIASQPNCCATGVGQLYNFTFAPQSFTNIAGAITYEAIKVDGTALPAWLKFAPETRTFFGIPPSANDIGPLTLKVSADVNLATISQTFTLEITQTLSAYYITQTISYTENQNYDLMDIVIITPSLNAAVQLILNDPAAGALTVATKGNVTPSYNPLTGIWQASGAKDTVNALLANLVFQPTANSYKNFHITVNITDGFGQQLNAKMNAFGRKPASQAILIGGIVGGISAAALVSGAAAFLIYRRKREQDRRLEIALLSPASWSFDMSLKPPRNEIEHYCLIPAEETDSRKVIEMYQRCPAPGMDIKRIEIIYNPKFEEIFLTRVELLENKAGNPAFTPNWPEESNMGSRAAVIDRIHQMTAAYRDKEYPGVKLLPTWHGIQPINLESIFKTGFISTEGSFGKGIYSACEAEYAHYIAPGTLLVSWVSFYSAYPVIDGDGEKLRGRGNYANYDAHFVPLRAVGRDPATYSFSPCVDINKAMYHEIVVFEMAQCLPRYLVELQPILPRAMSAKNSPVLSRAATAKQPMKQASLDQLPEAPPIATQGFFARPATKGRKAYRSRAKATASPAASAAAATPTPPETIGEEAP